jgi:hypothetical protein
VRPRREVAGDPSAPVVLGANWSGDARMRLGTEGRGGLISIPSGSDVRGSATTGGEPPVGPVARTRGERGCRGVRGVAGGPFVSPMSGTGAVCWREGFGAVACPGRGWADTSRCT